jgi:cytosine/adenosine deaminase-related metal-dependent hydrolase
LILLKDICALYTGDGEESGADVLIEGNRIKSIGKSLESAAAGGDLETIDCSGMVVMPGLVNTHHHFYQTLQRCVPQVQNEPLFKWLTKLYQIWKHLDDDAVHWSTLVACGELLKTGCTTSIDQFYVFPRGTSGRFIDIEIEAASAIGMRFQPARGSMSLGKSQGGLPPDEVVQTEDEILADSERLIEEYHDPGFGAMVRIALGPCSPFSVTRDLLVKTRDLADRTGALLHTHIAETKDEEEYCLEAYGMRPLELMKDCGWLGEDVWYAHGIHFNDEELEILKSSGTGICHCPTSNMRLGSGAARVPEMIEMGIRVGLGVDGSASNDSSDMLAELRNCFLLQRLVAGGGAITARQVIDIATRGGASLLARDDIGAIEEGKAADVIGIDVSDISHAGALHDYVASTVICGGGRPVRFSIVNGKVVVRDGELTQVDEAEVVKRANEAARRMISA